MVTGLGGDNDLIAIGREVLAQHSAKVGLGRTGRWAVVIRQIEMGDPTIESAQNDVTSGRVAINVTEIVPQAKRDAWQHQAAATTALVIHRSVAIGRGDETHGHLKIRACRNRAL